jgi:hypothetical protein
MICRSDSNNKITNEEYKVLVVDVLLRSSGRDFGISVESTITVLSYSVLIPAANRATYLCAKIVGWRGTCALQIVSFFFNCPIPLYVVNHCSFGALFSVDGSWLLGDVYVGTQHQDARSGHVPSTSSAA